MHEGKGDLWDWHQRGAVVVVTTNGAIDRQRQAIMVRGCARQARERFPDLHRILGNLLMQHGNHVFDLGRRLVSFPVEASPHAAPDLSLIDRSCGELVELADYKGWPLVIVPRPGCGAGGLEWAEVRPILCAHFDDRFTVITNQG